MAWYHYLAWFFAGVFLANVVPHWVSGVTGRPFQSPFAKPPGVGLSSSRVNVLWGALNLVAGYWLLCQVGSFDLRNPAQAATVASGALALSLHMAAHFGRFHGGDLR
jgi:hypothetical protein